MNDNYLLKDFEHIVKQVCHFKYLEGPKDKETVNKYVDEATWNLLRYMPSHEEYLTAKA